MSASVAGPMVYDCRHFPEEEYQKTILRGREDLCATAYSTVFITNESGTESELVAVAYSTGDVRLFHMQELTHTWLSVKKPGRHKLKWKAHLGPCYGLVCTGAGRERLLVSCGDDGFVRGWRLDELKVACSGGLSEGQPSPVFEVTVGQHQQAAIFNQQTSPAAQTLTVDEVGKRLFVGASDGSCHVVDLGVGGSPTSLTGHLAGVLGVDFCPETHQLASCSEDGTIRVWDSRMARSSHVIDPWNGENVSDNPGSVLQCLNSTYVSCVKFDPRGCWLVCGNGTSALSMWSLTLNSLAKQQSTCCVPQALFLQPGEILMAGTHPSLFRYRFSLETASTSPLTCNSAFAMDVDPASKIVAVCGTQSTLELFSHHGSKVGSVFVNNEEL